MTTNWAGNITYAASRLERPTTLEQVQTLVAQARLVRAVGSGHTFTSLPDTEGALISLADVPVDLQIDEAARTVTVGAGARYGDFVQELDRAGWALDNLASLPHISTVGSVATGTHGSGVGNQSLSAAVAALEIVGPDGALRTIRRGDADFDGSVVALGALGIVTRITLDIVPRFEVRQDVLLDLPWEVLTGAFDALAGSAYSVSFFTNWAGAQVDQVWVKSRDLDVAPTMPGARVATATTHMLRGGDARAVTAQLGEVGPWFDRLPHFRLAFTPSNGAELQSEYFVRRSDAPAAIEALRGIGEQIAQVVQVSEIRTIAADSLWLSPSEGADMVAFHFTWRMDTGAVYALTPVMEAALEPYAARPHWGKCFTTEAGQLAHLWPRWSDFWALRQRVDAEGKFDNELLRAWRAST